MKLRPLRDPIEMPLDPLEQHPRLVQARTELAALEARYAMAERRRAVALARSRGQEPTRSLLERTRDLLAGGEVRALPPAFELEAAAEETKVLTGPLVAKREEIAKIRGEISHEVCTRFAELNAEALRNALAAAEQLHESLLRLGGQSGVD